MTNKMSVCSIKYTYTRYAGVDIEEFLKKMKKRWF